MIFALIPFFLIELYLSLKTGEEIGFFWSVIWIILSFMLGMMLLQKSSQTMLGNMQSMRQGKLDMRRFQNASMSYFIGAVLLMIPGVFSDFLGLIALIKQYIHPFFQHRCIKCFTQSHLRFIFNV